MIGVGEHVRHHQDQRLRGQRELTCIVDLVPARSGSLYKNLLADRGETFSQVSNCDSKPLPGTARMPSMTNSRTQPNQLQTPMLLITAGLDSPIHTHL